MQAERLFVSALAYMRRYIRTHMQRKHTEQPASQRATITTRALHFIGHSPARSLSTRHNFTHRLCDKKRDSANLLIRLFFRPSSIADAATSIFVLQPRVTSQINPRKGEEEGVTGFTRLSAAWVRAGARARASPGDFNRRLGRPIR